jgi:hypothetical protein
MESILACSTCCLLIDQTSKLLLVVGHQAIYIGHHPTGQCGEGLLAGFAKPITSYCEQVVCNLILEGLLSCLGVDEHCDHFFGYCTHGVFNDRAALIATVRTLPS